MLEHSARRVLHAQVQQEWAQIVESDRPARAGRGESFWGMNLLARGAIQETAMLVLMMEAAAGRGKQGQLPGPSCWGENYPPGQEWLRSEDSPGDAVLLTPVPMGNAGAHGYAAASRKPNPATRFGPRYL